MKKENLSACLQNSFYCGRIEHKYLDTSHLDKPYLKGVQEPLISEAMFDHVQNVFSGNHRGYEHADKTPRFPLKRCIFCAKDGHLMTGYTTKGKEYYKCPEKDCRTNISANEVHQQFSALLDRYKLSDAFIPVFTKVLDKKYRENEDMKAEAISNLKKNFATLRTKQKTVTMRYAMGEIDKAVFDEVHGDLGSEILVVENELQQLENNISNLSKYITKSVEIASQLGDYWRKKDFKLCQKIQKLAFPGGIKWDGEKRCFRTDGENVFLAKIALVEASDRIG